MILYRALYDYKSEESCDLNFEKDDIIEYLSQSSESWYRGRNLMTEKVGLFPYNFVSKIDMVEINQNLFVLKENTKGQIKGDIIIATEIRKFDIEGYVWTDEEQKCVHIPLKCLINVQEKSAKSEFTKCLANIDSVEGDSSQLSFRKSDIIWMTKKLDKNFGEGIINGKKGTFSLLKVDIEDNERCKSIDRQNRWVALFDYNSGNTSDLKLLLNEKLKFLDRIDNNWLLMQNQNGQVGMVPYNFVKNISVRGLPQNQKSEDNVDAVKDNRQANVAMGSIIHDLRNNNRGMFNNNDTKRDSQIQEVMVQNQEEHFTPTLSTCVKDDYLTKGNCTFVEKLSMNFETNKDAESLSMQLDKKENVVENDMEVIMNDILSIKNNLLRQDSDQDYIQLMTNNLAFLKEEYQEKQKQLSLIKQQKDKFLNGNIVDQDISDYYSLLNSEEIEKKYTTRTRAIAEILETEVKFINDMKLTLRTFNLPQMNNKISEQEYYCIFGDLDAIITISEDFHSHLSKAVDEYGVEVHIGSIFSKFLHSFETVYKEYCVNYDRKLELINKKPRSQEMDDFMKEGLRKINESGTMIASIDAMLVKPLQRFLKYPLFMKTIIQNTNEGHVDLKDLKSALLQFEIIAKKINEKKRFEELRTDIFERNGQWHQKTLHAIQKVPKRFLVASLYGSQQDDDIEYHNAVVKFKNLKKCVSFFIETIIILRDNLKDVLMTYSALNEDLNQMMLSTFGSQLHQYILICKNGESNYYKNYNSALESVVINPLSKLLELFYGPKILIKKRKSKYLDYLGMKQKMDKEITKMQAERLEDLNNQYLAINNTLKEELPILTSKSTVIFNECLSNYLELTTSTLQSSIDSLISLLGSDTVSEEEQRNNRNSQIEILNTLQRNILTYNSRNDVNRLELFYTNPLRQRTDTIGRSDFYRQTEEDVVNLKIKFEGCNLAYVKKDFFPTKPHQIYVSKDNIVGIIKRCDPQGHASSWLVEASVKRVGFVPRSYLNSVPFTKESQYSVATDSTLRNSMNFNQGHQYSLVDTSNIDLMQFSPNNPNLRSISLFCNNPLQEIRIARFDFKSTGQTDISMMKGDQLSLIESHDRAGNKSWSLVRNLRTGAQGYVPTNYMSSDS